MFLTALKALSYFAYVGNGMACDFFSIIKVDIFGKNTYNF